MSAIIEAKKQQVDVIAEQLKNSVSTVIVDYRGLTVAEVLNYVHNYVKLVLSTKFTKTLWFVVQLNKQVSKA